MPNIAILFWFYKEKEICENRLQILKKSNPTAKIYGLYGGSHDEEGSFRSHLDPYFDDFYMSSSTDSDWKWLHGDLAILEWYQSRGKNLEWDSIAVTQWDMLVFESIDTLLPGIQKDEIFLSGLRDLDKQVEEFWWHASATEEIRENRKAFFKYVRNTYGYDCVPPLCCQFIFEVLPRIFFEKYATVENKEVGMLEYKVPTYADIFKIPFYKKDIGVAWEELGEDFHHAPLNASPRGELSEGYIRLELAKSDGWRLFHPYSKMWTQ